MRSWSAKTIVQGPDERLMVKRGGKAALEESENTSMSLVVVCDDKVLSWPEFFLEYEGNLSHYLF